eukprot:1176876-Prorocentrum_minimum.AAC.2
MTDSSTECIVVVELSYVLISDFERVSFSYIESEIIPGFSVFSLPKLRRRLNCLMQSFLALYMSLVLYTTGPLRVPSALCRLSRRLAQVMSIVDEDDDEREGGAAVRVYANELEVRLGRTTGALEISLQGPLDKGDTFERVCSKAKLTPGIRVRSPAPPRPAPPRPAPPRPAPPVSRSDDATSTVRVPLISHVLA